MPLTSQPIPPQCVPTRYLLLALVSRRMASKRRSAACGDVRLSCWRIAGRFGSHSQHRPQEAAHRSWQDGLAGRQRSQLESGQLRRLRPAPGRRADRGRRASSPFSPGTGLGAPSGFMASHDGASQANSDAAPLAAGCSRDAADPVRQPALVAPAGPSRPTGRCIPCTPPSSAAIPECRSSTPSTESATAAPSPPAGRSRSSMGGQSSRCRRCSRPPRPARSTERRPCRRHPTRRRCWTGRSG
jgi:hypothetical protein